MNQLLAARRRQARGVILVSLLGILLAVVLGALLAMRTALDDELSARNARDRELAFHAAEAALADAEQAIAAHALEPAPGPVLWTDAELDDSAGSPYGSVSGAQFAAGRGVLPERAPRFLIEAIAPIAGMAGGAVYRATAIGFGARAANIAVVQSLYRRDGAAGAPAGRISWREIANWRELHAAAH